MKLLFFCAVCGCILAAMDQDYIEAIWAAHAAVQMLIIEKLIAARGSKNVKQN